MASSDIFWFGQAHSVKKGGRASHKGNSSEPTPVLRTTTDFVVISMALKGPAKTWKKTTSPLKSLRIPYVTFELLNLCTPWDPPRAHLSIFQPLGHPYTRAHEEYKV